MSQRFHLEAEAAPPGAAIERRLLLAVAAAAALIGGAALGLTELLRDPVTGQWLGDGMDRLLVFLSICR